MDKRIDRIALVAFFWLMFLSLRWTTALNTSVIFTLVPGISGIYSAIILQERLGRYRLLALLFAMAGALWVIFHGDLSKMLSLQLGKGDLIFFYGCLFMAAYTPLVKLLQRSGVVDAGNGMRVSHHKILCRLERSG